VKGESQMTAHNNGIVVGDDCSSALLITFDRFVSINQQPLWETKEGH
jgi:hypothetical protein